MLTALSTREESESIFYINHQPEGLFDKIYFASVFFFPFEVIHVSWDCLNNDPSSPTTGRE